MYGRPDIVGNKYWYVKILFMKHISVANMLLEMM